MYGVLAYTPSAVQKMSTQFENEANIDGHSDRKTSGQQDSVEWTVELNCRSLSDRLRHVVTCAEEPSRSPDTLVH